jgi:hypothetical protein
MSQPVDTVLTFFSSSVQLPRARMRERFQRRLYDRIFEYLTPLAVVHPVRVVMGAVRHRIQKTRAIKRRSR